MINVDIFYYSKNEVNVPSIGEVDKN